MVDWGLDLAQLYDPALNSVVWLAHGQFPMFNPEKIQRIHRLALSKGAYGAFADAWLPDSGLERYLLPSLYGLSGYILRLCLSLDPKSMQLMLPHLRPGHYSLPAMNRLTFFFSPDCRPDADSLKFTLRLDGNFSPEDVRELDHDGFPLINLMAWHYKDTDTHDNIGRHKWRKLTQDIIRTTTLLHCKTMHHKFLSWYHPSLVMGCTTTLRSVLSGIYGGFDNRDTFSKWRRATERALLHWLEDLEACGVDLNMYGETQKNLLSELENSEFLDYGLTVNSFLCFGETWRLENFIYGTKPRGWQFSWDLGIEVLHGQFWVLVENPPLHIVGAWVDDSDEED